MWADYILHAVSITSFAQSAVPLHSFFHFAGYMVPATVKGLADVPGLVCATALFTTLGYILMGIGAYALGNVLAGRAGEHRRCRRAVAYSQRCPLWLSQSLFRFYWLEQITTGGSQATGLAFVAIALAVLPNAMDRRAPFGFRSQHRLAFWHFVLRFFCRSLLLGYCCSHSSGDHPKSGCASQRWQ